MVLGGRAKIHVLPQARLQGRYSKLNAVGAGSYGEVFKVLDLTTGVLYVWKEAILAKVDGSFANEIASLTKLRHPNIVAIHEWGTEDGKMCIVLEFVTGGSLDDVIHQLKDPLPERMMRDYVRQILLALEYCHLHGIVHRDVKAKNILVTQEGILKLADFGGAKEAVALLGPEMLEATAGLQATLLWMAPELHDSRFNCKADIWSLGCTIIEMATRKKPWDEQKFENVFAAMKFLKKAKGGPPMPKNLSPAAQAFLTRCFTKDPTTRPTATELLADEWFRTEEGSCESPFAFSATSNSSNSSNSSSAASTGSEAPQGPSASSPTGPNNSVSTSTSVTEVKFNVGDGALSQSQAGPSGFAEIHEEEMKRNWIFDLSTSLPGAALHVPVTPAIVPPDQLLSTMDFLSMKSAVDD
jgi:serine/threonine protein kinase